MRVFQFDLCSFLILTLVIISLFLRKLYNGKMHRMFLAFVLLIYANTIADIFSSAPLPLSGSTLENVREISTFCYFILHASIMPLYTIFMGTAAGTWTGYMTKNKANRFIFCLPYVINLGFVLSNPWTHWIFRIEDGTYKRGELILVTYLAAAFYILHTFYFLLRYRGALDKRRIMAFLSIYPYSLFALTIQYLNPRYLVEMFAYTVAILTLLMFIIRPEETMNSAVGAKTSTAFTADIQRIYLSGRDNNVQIIKLNSDGSLIKLYGINKHDRIIRELVSRIHAAIKNGGGRVSDYNVYYLNYGLLAVSIGKKYASEQRAQELYEALSSKIRTDNIDISVECALCDLNIPDDMATAEDLLDFIDTFEKSNVGAGVFVYSKLTRQEKIQMNFDIDRYIRKAIKNKSFSMYYQPIYCVKENRFVTAEALIRLSDDEVGFISPAVFIPAAEKSGAIYEIGDFVINSVFSFVGKAEQYGVKYIEINISAMQCMNDSFAQDILDKLNEYGVSEKSVNFELTESASAIIDDVLSKTVSKLHSVGIEFSIDDYGTGYSNLHRLMSEPIKLIKIDRSLICELSNEKTRAVLADTIRMIKSIGMEIVAEGVETAETADWLIEKGCDYIQGFYYAKPMPESEYIEFLKNSV